MQWETSLPYSDYSVLDRALWVQWNLSVTTTCIIKSIPVIYSVICFNEGWMYQFTLVNILKTRRNEHFADDIFKRIFVNENVWITIKNSLKFIPKGPTNNIPALVKIMAWRRPGYKPLSEPMLVSLPTHICVTWPQWVNNFCLLEII